jgi:glycosyltransferase involved in cell wall biosynthesis
VQAAIWTSRVDRHQWANALRDAIGRILGVCVKVLAAVFNSLAYDGRVQRACEALAEIADVDLFCLEGPDHAEGLPFSVTPVRLSRSPIFRSIRYVEFCRRFLSHARRERPDLIHAHDYYLALPGAIAARTTRAKLIYDAHELVIPEAMRTLSLRERFFYSCERFAVPRADLIIAANEERASLMAGHYLLDKPPLVVRNIQPWVEPCVPTRSNPAAQSADDKWIIYQGHVSLARGLDRILAAVPFLPPYVKLQILGGGPDDRKVRDEVQRLNIADRVGIIGRVPKEKVQDELRRCHVGVLVYPFVGLNNIYCAPNKLYEYAQARLPVVATAQPPLKSAVEGYGIGVTYGPEATATEIAECIMRVIRDTPAFSSGLGRFLADHSWQHEAERLRAVVEGLG